MGNLAFLFEEQQKIKNQLEREPQIPELKYQHSAIENFQEKDVTIKKEKLFKKSLQVDSGGQSTGTNDA